MTDFPGNPNPGDYTSDNRWRWDGVKWVSTGPPPGAQGPAGSAGEPGGQGAAGADWSVPNGGVLNGEYQFFDNQPNQSGWFRLGDANHYLTWNGGAPGAAYRLGTPGGERLIYHTGNLNPASYLNFTSPVVVGLRATGGFARFVIDYGGGDHEPGGSTVIYQQLGFPSDGRIHGVYFATIQARQGGGGWYTVASA